MRDRHTSAVVVFVYELWRCCEITVEHSEANYIQQHTVVTVAVDSGMKYLSTKLYAAN